MSQTFLIIEDSGEDAFLIRRAFSGSACQPFVCRNASEARAYLLGAGIYHDRDKFPFPGVIVSDIELGEESGIQFLAWLRKQPEFTDLPVIMFSGAATPKDVALARQLGAVKVLTKPSDPIAVHDVLVKLIRELCPSGTRGRVWPDRKSVNKDWGSAPGRKLNTDSPD